MQYSHISFSVPLLHIIELSSFRENLRAGEWHNETDTKQEQIK